MDNRDLEVELELTDLGDVTVETKQCAPAPWFVDSHFGWGTHEYQHGHPPQC